MEYTKKVLLIISCYVLVLGTAKSENSVKRIEIFYMDPMTSTGTALSVDDLPKMLKANYPEVSFMSLRGDAITSYATSLLREELKLPTTGYWLRNSLDARIVFRFFISEGEYLQITFENSEVCEWNNIKITAVKKDTRRKILRLLPEIFFKKLI